MTDSHRDRLALRRPAGRLRAAGVACLVALLATGCSRARETVPDAAAARPPQPVEVTTIRRQNLEAILNLVGTARAWESAQVHPELAGIVEQILFEEGRTVRRGETLLKIDDSQLRAEVDRARAEYRLAEQTLERIDSLRRANSLAEVEYDRAVAAFQRAEAELQLVTTMQRKTEIKAPFAGIVGARTVSPGDYVTPAVALTSVDDVSRLRVSFEVPQRYLEHVRTGARFAVRTDDTAACGPVPGDVYFVSATVDRRTRSSQVDGVLRQPPESLRPGMFVNVSLVLEVHENVLTVPEGAIFMSVSGPQIVVAQPAGDGFEAAFVPVELGLRSEGIVEIRTSEPVEGVSVVAAGVGALSLYPGTRLAPRPAVTDYEPLSRY